MDKCFESFKSMETMSEVCDLKKRLLSLAKAEVDRDPASVDTKELGEVIDMVKDLAQTEASCYEACYYKTVTAAMEERGEDFDDLEEATRMGYNTHHYASGRFAPKGRGMVVGYNPIMHQVPYVDSYLNDPDFVSDMKRMGYDGAQDRNSAMQMRSDNRRYGYMMPEDRDWDDADRTERRYGKSYNDFLRSRRHYTTSQSPEAREDMERHANEYVADTMNTIKDIYKSADAEQKKRLKNDLTKLIGEMT